MSFFFVAVAVLLLVAVGWFSRRRFLGWKKPPLPEAGKPVKDGDDFPDLNEKFLGSPKKKTEAVALVRAYHSDDLMLLRSLLDAEGVETFVQPSSLGELYPTVSTVGLGDSVITIFKSDLDVACRVVEDYLAGWEDAEGVAKLVRNARLKPEWMVPRS